jgi:hypothetical protein
MFLSKLKSDRGGIKSKEDKIAWVRYIRFGKMSFSEILRIIKDGGMEMTERPNVT